MQSPAKQNKKEESNSETGASIISIPLDVTAVNVEAIHTGVGDEHLLLLILSVLPFTLLEGESGLCSIPLLDEHVDVARGHHRH